MYKCAQCNREGEPLINNRQQRRCRWCYAILSDSMLVQADEAKPAEEVAVVVPVTADEAQPADEVADGTPARTTESHDHKKKGAKK